MPPEAVAAWEQDGLLGWYAGLVFLGPLASAIAGAYLADRVGSAEAAGRGPGWAALGLLGGLAVGVLAASAWVRWRRGRTDGRCKEPRTQ